MEPSIGAVMLKLLVAVIIGFGAGKKGILNNAVNKGLSALVVNITCPFLIVYVAATQEQASSQVTGILGFGFLLYGGLVLLSYGLSSIFFSGGQRGMHQLLLTFSNVSFMGLPLVESLYGQDAVFLINILHIPFNLLIFTWGIFLLTENRERIQWKKIMQGLPGILASLLALGISLTGISVPGMLLTPLSFIGSVTTPLSMLVMGGILAQYSFKEIWGEKRVYLLAVWKLLVYPLAGFLLANLFFEDAVIIGVITLSMGMPSASMCVMLCAQYGGDEKTASAGVMVTTLLSFITLPFLMLWMT